MPNFSEINTVATGDAILRDATPAYIEVNAKYIAGDHLQGGSEWTGPPPPPEQEEEAMKRLNMVWTPAPVVNEGIENHVSGILGRELDFRFVLANPPQKGDGDKELTAEEKAIDLTNSHLGRWFDEKGCLLTLQEWCGRLRYAGRAPLRIRVVMEKQENGTYAMPEDVKTPEDVLSYIFLDAPPVDKSTVYIDERTKRECGIYRYDESQSPFRSDLTQGTARRMEKVFVADKNEPQRGEGRPAFKRGHTVLQIIQANDGVVPEGAKGQLQGDPVIQEVVFPCAGLSLIFERRLPLLLDDPAKRLQRALNLINTLLAINAIYAGFRSRDYFNANDEPPEGSESEGVSNGPARAMFWYSQPYVKKNADGKEETAYLAPTLVTTEPVDSRPILELAVHYERQLRRRFRQEHTLNSGSEASAVSLIQQRSAFLVSLLVTKPAVEDALVWLQTVVWCLALYLSGKESEIDSFIETYRATAQAKPYTGPLTPEEIRVVIEMVSANLMSRDIAIGLLGTEDLDAEIARINAQDANDPNMTLLRVQIYAALKEAGEGKIAAATIAGLSEEEIKLLTTDFTGVPTR